MQAASYFSTKHLKNTYIISADNSNKTLLVDPFEIELPLFELLEKRGLIVDSVLLTHGDAQNVPALLSLPRIYGSISIYGGLDAIAGIPITNVKEMAAFRAADIEIEPIFLPGHHSDSIIYRIGSTLFTGELLEAGLVVKADESYGRALLIQCIKETLFSLPKEMVILPSQGPPSSIGIEIETNDDLQGTEERITNSYLQRLFTDF
ncbi:MBL fold metallo-hydrolase [Spirochaeta lutea]|uniref:Metallo-beta-lactamase domain-containing protein n=1 Tax=Spirochaeta lutea TaxID=1480694 RepID=A0A098R0Q4_9SPIO|nr:MBL fold metallo-hydrolase [Spirochaeta lutea]KGE73745.1 hypothetical protein DC28_00475 [Spirochaeta lutea]